VELEKLGNEYINLQIPTKKEESDVSPSSKTTFINVYICWQGYVLGFWQKAAAASPAIALFCW